MPLFGPPSIERMEKRGDVDGLMKALFDTKDAFTRRPQAAKALASVQRQAAIPTLIQLFELYPGKKIPRYKEIIEVLLNLGPAGIQSLANLGRQGNMVIIDGLIAILGNPNAGNIFFSPPVNKKSKAVEETLKLIGEPMVEPLWKACLDHEGPSFTLSLISILREHCSDRSFDILMKIIKGKDWFYRNQAGDALLQWYKAGRLTDAQKKALLEQRTRITTQHEDHKNVHTDFAASQYHLDRDCFTGAHVDSPPHGHQDTTNPHSDNGGMGLEFPL